MHAAVRSKAAKRAVAARSDAQLHVATAARPSRPAEVAQPSARAPVSAPAPVKIGVNHESQYTTQTSVLFRTKTFSTDCFPANSLTSTEMFVFRKVLPSTSMSLLLMPHTRTPLPPTTSLRRNTTKRLTPFCSGFPSPPIPKENSLLRRPNFGFQKLSALSCCVCGAR